MRGNSLTRQAHNRNRQADRMATGLQRSSYLTVGTRQPLVVRGRPDFSSVGPATRAHRFNRGHMATSNKINDAQSRGTHQAGALKNTPYLDYWEEKVRFKESATLPGTI